MAATILAFPGVRKERMAAWVPQGSLAEAWAEHLDMLKRLAARHQLRKAELPSDVEA